MSVLQTLKSRLSFIKNEASEMGKGDEDES